LADPICNRRCTRLSAPILTRRRGLLQEVERLTIASHTHGIGRLQWSPGLANAMVGEGEDCGNRSTHIAGRAGEPWQRGRSICKCCLTLKLTVTGELNLTIIILESKVTSQKKNVHHQILRICTYASPLEPERLTGFFFCANDNTLLCCLKGMTFLCSCGLPVDICSWKI
jgi:hypothetical protein